MIVVDASVMVELLLSAEANPRIVGRLLDPEEAIHAPHLLDVALAEVLEAHFKLATEIILLRRQRGLTRRQLSTKSGVQQAIARRITTGAP